MLILQTHQVEPRVFDEVPVLYGNMTSVMSGGLVYEYYNEPSNSYGLVNFNDNGTVSLLVDYDNLQSQYNRLDIKSLESGNSSATGIQSPKCDSGLIQSGSFSNSFDIPSVPSGGQDLIDKGISNPSSGKIVPITQTQVSMTVYSSNGSPVNNLAIKPLADDQSNTPNGGSTSSTASGSGSKSSAAPSPTATKKSAGCYLRVGACSLAGIVASAVLSLFATL